MTYAAVIVNINPRLPVNEAMSHPQWSPFERLLLPGLLDAAALGPSKTAARVSTLLTQLHLG